MDKKYKIKDIYDKLKKIGFDKSYLKKFILPDWWDDEIAKTTNGFIIFCGIISKNINIDYNSLINDENIKLSIINSEEDKEKLNLNHKMNSNYSENDILLAELISLKIAKLINSVNKNKFKDFPSDVNEIRKTILSNNDMISFENLLDYCWKSGISVIHVSNFPKKAKKFEGLSGYIDNKPFIILSKNQKNESYQLFTLAHELGHLILKHSNNSKLIYDYDLTLNRDIVFETQANQFATKLITNYSEIEYPSKTYTSPQLYEYSLSVSKKHKIDAGFIALNYAKTFNRFPVANGALKKLGNNNAIAVMYKYLTENINSDDLHEDTIAFIMNIVTKEAV